MKISVFGLGYVGSVNAACLAELGHKVIGVDIKDDKVKKINKGFSPVKEPGLEEIVKRNFGKRLFATTNVKRAVKNSDIGMICVGTPSNYGGEIDASRVFDVFYEISKNAAGPYTVVIRSTIPPGTISKLEQKAEGKISVVMNPEFLREGDAVEDFFNPGIIVIGSSKKQPALKVSRIYKGVKGEFKITDCKTAEMIKYVSNSWHALKISFTNEISSIASREGIDPHELMKIFRSDTRLNVSERYHRPGFAYGGSCLPKDTRALVKMAHSSGLNIPLISSIENSNQEHIERALRIILETGQREVGFFGISFKYSGSSGDVRGSPVITLAHRLMEVGFSRLFDKGHNLHIYDPVADITELTRYLPHLRKRVIENIDGFVAKSRVIVIGSSIPGWEELSSKLKNHHTIIDLQGSLKKSGITRGKYVSLY